MNRSDELTAEREAALAQHRQGALDVADAAYRQILAHQPSDPETHHLLGILQGQKGDSGARALIRCPVFSAPPPESSRAWRAAVCGMLAFRSIEVDLAATARRALARGLGT